MEISQNLQTPNPDVQVQFFAIDIPQGALPALNAEILDYVNISSDNRSEKLSLVILWKDYKF